MSSDANECKPLVTGKVNLDIDGALKPKAGVAGPRGRAVLGWAPAVRATGSIKPLSQPAPNLDRMDISPTRFVGYVGGENFGFVG